MSERRNHLLLVGLILAALIGALALILPASPAHREAVLGLDLQGGYEVVLKAKPPPGRPLQASDLDRSVDIMRDRIDKFGVAEPEIRKQGKDQIAIELPGVDNPGRIRTLLGSTALLELYDFQTALTGPSVQPETFVPLPSETIYDLLSAAETQTLVKKNGAKDYYLFETKGKKLLAGPLPKRDALLETDAATEAGVKDGKLPKGFRVFAVPRSTVIISCGDRSDFCPPNVPDPVKSVYYLFKHNVGQKGLELKDTFPQMAGGDLRLGGTRADIDPTTSQPVVLMQFTKEGAKKFHEVTREEAQRGSSLYSLSGGQGDKRNYFQSFAIVLDNELITAPTINFDENPDGIPGTTGAQIEGVGEQEAKDIALVLQTGALPVEFEALSETEISATLGEDSLRQAVRAALVGLAVVALFLLLFYRFLGLVAVIGLGIYAVFLYAMILLFNVTLTLPGFAGMILTIGVAADANIVIFERIKEEARGGKSVRAAIAAGYAKGFSTIVDANMVTAITAIVLFVLATAGVKGFALMLLIGTAMSLITAVFATRAMLGLLRGFRWFNSPAFMGATGVVIPRWIQHDYVGKRLWWFGISGLVLLVSVVSLAIQGLNLGIDFKGGTELSFKTPQPVEVADVRTQAGKVGEAGAVIQGIGPELDGKFREFQIRAKALTPGEQDSLKRNVEEDFNATNFGATTVSASFGEQIARSAIQAIFFSLLLVVLYITVRFQWKFALATIVAMLHDIVIAVGIYSVAGLEVTTSTVAAILTVLGYSIYDTIIILDRVRENIPLMRRATMTTIANLSLWETIRRSLATTFITLLPVGSLYFFGGDTLKDFAFALLVGIGSGAYSSIFIAAPLVAALKEREPEYARRRETAVEKEGVTMPVEEPALVTAGGDGAVRDAAPATTPEPKAASKRDRRRQRRSTRPHGRAR